MPRGLVTFSAHVIRPTICSIRPFITAEVFVCLRYPEYEQRTLPFVADANKSLCITIVVKSLFFSLMIFDVHVAWNSRPAAEHKRKGEMDQEYEEHECNCMPVGGDPNAPTCYDDQCHNYATMQECRKGRCHRGCRNQRIQVRITASSYFFRCITLSLCSWQVYVFAWSRLNPC